MAVRLSCPSCNTSFTLPTLPADRRATCPRCDDVFPVRSWEETADAGSPPADTPRAALRAPRSNRRAVLIALAMGLVGLTVGLVVYYTRGGVRGKPRPEPTPAAAVTPATQLAGHG